MGEIQFHSVGQPSDFMVFIHWLEAVVKGLDSAIKALTDLAPQGTFLNFEPNLRGLLAVILVCLICGGVGSLVVSNRMAFFSDALAHCAFAGVALGLLVGIFAGAQRGSDFDHWGIPAIMVAFGILVGLAIAYVRAKTGLASDTVIGVFFAGAIGFGAMLFKALSTFSFISPENFLFGDPTLTKPAFLLVLFLLAVVTGGLLLLLYNKMVFASFNPSLARSRQIPLGLCNYLFIALLAMIVNLCFFTVGTLLINALLVVPAATAVNLSRNMRQLFWRSISLSLIAGICGTWVSWDVGIPNPNRRGEMIHFGPAGTIVVVSVLLFFASMIVRPWLRGRQAF